MKFANNRLVRALRLAFYPAFESAAARHFQALTREAQDARNAGDLARAEELYLRAIADAESSSDQSHLRFIRYGLAHLYQEQRKYREAERIFREGLQEALKSPESSMQVHGAHMCLAGLYQAEGQHAKAEEHYQAALAQTDPGLLPERETYFSTALSVARFYAEQHRYGDAEPLFKRALEIREGDRVTDTSLPYYLHEFAKVLEAQEKYTAAEEVYRRALKICEQLDQPKDLTIVRALDELAQFFTARGRYSEAEDPSRRSLLLVEEKINRHTAAGAKGWPDSMDRKTIEATLKRARVPISEALERLADIYERQEKYAESAPLRSRSIEIKQEAWGERNGWIWVGSLAAYANALHKLGREHEAAKLDERVEAIRSAYPEGAVRRFVQLRSMPIRRTLRGRFAVFINALRHPSPR